MTKNAVSVQPEPSSKGIVHLDKLAIAQARKRDDGRAGTKGRAEALLASAQKCSTVAQKLFRAHEFDRAFCDASLKRCVELADFVLCPLALGDVRRDATHRIRLSGAVAQQKFRNDIQPFALIRGYCLFKLNRFTRIDYSPVVCAQRFGDSL